MSNIAIQFDHVGKLYHLGVVGTGTLSHDLNRWWKTCVLGQEDPYLKIGETNDRSKKGSSEFVWALKDISFDIEQGDVVGIIGKNGAGKSTLLKLLSRITTPTTGMIRARGRIGSLLEVGTGFHPEMTGRENIYMNGSIMGMTRSEITRKLDEIVDFAGVERYLDTPVKRYSSGMTVRLGFAVAAFMEPEILVVDEVLAVGDAEFQKKAIGKMQDVAQGGGRTVLFVSHNMSSVKSLCNRGVVLEKGIVAFQGEVVDAVNFYLMPTEDLSGRKIVDAISKTSHRLQIHTIEINGTEYAHSTITAGQNTFIIKVKGEAFQDLLMDLMLIIKNKEEVPMATLAEGHCKGLMQDIKKGVFVIEKEVILPRFLSSGDYIIDFYLHRPMMEGYIDAPHCAEIHIDGYQDGYGRALSCSKEGFFGLECINH